MSLNRNLLHVEVTGSSIDSQTISKALRNNSVILNSELSLPNGNSILIGEVVTSSMLNANISIDGILTEGYYIVDKNTKIVVYHFTQERVPVGFPAVDPETMLYTTSAFPGVRPQWDLLAFSGDIQYHLLYSLISTFRLSQGNIDSSIISCHRIILLSGPPGTGKTSLCQAMAEKLAIRLGKSVYYLQVNCQALLSKWFSESGKIVKRLFEDVRMICKEYPNNLVVVAFDEIESILVSRETSFKGAEPSDTIRAVNSMLTELDSAKELKNLIMMYTSNFAESIDSAFMSRVDYHHIIANLSISAIYKILIDMLQELGKGGIISNVPVPLPSYQAARVENKYCKLIELAEMMFEQKVNGRELRRLPFKTLSHFSMRSVSEITFQMFIEVSMNLLQKIAVAPVMIPQR